MERAILSLHYTDDLFISWRGTDWEFVSKLKKSILDLGVTVNISKEKLNFLETLVEIKDGALVTYLYRTATAGNTILHALSSHSKTMQWNIPYRELLRP
ncbi:hypothetical protein NDU88_000365 [Pleurodeles waltl]|uniref:Reverse transcriptase domain-containing protein n=1 Tax=Pleurodeles waltl TaxID=8319 RepID=A0AAV7TGI0_PLEWA|nr:hypothetical protein NDU88_000365 [Pleurodeles waltl]